MSVSDKNFQAPPSTPGDRANRPAVTIVTGFLGAGKTTWLSSVLRDPHGMRIAVVVNDVGAVNIDAALIRRIESRNGTRPTTVELANGCVCCSVRDELAEAVAELAAKREHEHIVIECSGVAEPQPISRLFTKQNVFGRSLDDFARLHAVIAVVDTPELLRHCKTDPSSFAKRRFINPDQRPRPLAELMMLQIEGADIVALNKSDRVTPAMLDEAELIVLSVNSRAEIHRTTQSTLPPEIWPGAPRFERREEDPATWVRVLTQSRGQAVSGLHNAGAGLRPRPSCRSVEENSAQKYGLETFVFSERRPVNETRLQALLASGLPGVVRAKGFFWTTGRPDDIGFVSLAGGVVSVELAGTWAAALRERGVLTLGEIPQEILLLWREPYGDRRQEIVFIGRDLDECALRSSLESCLDDLDLTSRTIQKRNH